MHQDLRSESHAKVKILQEAVGINAELLDKVQRQILSIYSSKDSDSEIVRQNNDLCKHTLELALTRATTQLIDDLLRKVRILGTPER